MITKDPKILYKELSYKIVGSLFDVYKQLGGDYHEKYYQSALSKIFRKNGIAFQKEMPFDIVIEGEFIGKHYVDFVVDGKVAVELKKGNRFRMGDVKQVLMYLKTTNLQLGILAYFGSNGVRTKRVVNKYFVSVSEN